MPNRAAQLSQFYASTLPGPRRTPKQALTDELTEAISAVIEVQDSYARDWTMNVHDEAWARQLETRKSL